MQSVSELVESNLVLNLWDKLSSAYTGKNVIVTGGASFIGSNLVDLLISLGANVKVLDDLSSGVMSNLGQIDKIEFFECDLRSRETTFEMFNGGEIIFHLAAVHGGRGFIETYKQEMLVNLAIDNNVFSAGVRHKVKMMVHASSACAYPITLQEDEKDRHLLEEHEASMDAPETSFADGVYGWTKLIGEYQLQNHVSSKGMRGRSARIFTAYGERENESHAAIALIAKALLGADPYPIWGNGEQTRNFTHVADTALGLLFLGSDKSDRAFDVFNIGTSDHVKVIDFVQEIFKQLNWNPNEIDFQLDKPTGVASRASNNKKIRDAFGWEPSIGIDVGIQRTLAWYESLPSRPKNLAELEERLSAR
jgi:nucleoside-diphosphate-sugar epimerase